VIDALYELTTLAKFARHTVVTGPILRKKARPHIAVERRIRPIAHTLHERVLDGVDVAILDVPRIIRLIL